MSDRTPRHGAVATGAAATGAASLGAMAMGAAALGALAVGALAIGRLSIGRARLRRVDIGELRVGRLDIGTGGPDHRGRPRPRRARQGRRAARAPARQGRRRAREPPRRPARSLVDHDLFLFCAAYADEAAFARLAAPPRLDALLRQAAGAGLLTASAEVPVEVELFAVV